MDAKAGCELGFRFVAPNAQTLEIAEALRESSDQDERLVAATAIEVGELSRKTMADLHNAVEHRGHCDLAPYFDRDMTRASEAANRLLSATSADAKLLAKCVIDQAAAIADSRNAFLEEARRSSKPR